MSQTYKEKLIPRQVLFGNPDKIQCRISPLGTRISYLAPVNGVLNIWVADINQLENAKPITKDTKRGIQFHAWAFTNNHIFYIQDKKGDENWHIFVVDLETNKIKNLTPITGVQARFQQGNHKYPQEILIGLNDRTAQFHDIYRLNIITGEKELIQQNDGFTGFITDHEYRVRFAIRMNQAGEQEILRSLADNKWDTVITVGMEDTLTFHIIGFDKSGKNLYLIESFDRNTAALSILPLDDGDKPIFSKKKLLAENSTADVSDLLVHPTEYHIQAAAFTYQRKQWQILDKSIEQDINLLKTIDNGEIEIVNSTLDNNKWIVAFLKDDAPLNYYLYDRPMKATQFLFTNKKQLKDYHLCKMQSVIIKSRDNLNLVSYYTLPPDGNKKPLPLVLLVHGGPWHRDIWGYNALHQWLANRGYAVLSVNFRASTGLGKAFINAGNMEWSGKMHDDLTDAVSWAKDQGIADPEHIAIMGGSYGGYATLVGLTFTPDTFACGVDIVGPSNLVTLLETIPPYWKPQIELFKKRVGDHTTENGKKELLKKSPLTYADKIKKPLLIGQGKNDPRVKQAESDQIVKSLKRKNIPVTYVLYPDEGHGFVRPENRISFFTVAEAFLAECLGGRFEQVGKDFAGSSITVPEGKEYIPGLK